MLGGVVAQLTNLGVPFLIRAGILALMLVVAFIAMRDVGFTPDRSEGPLKAVNTVFRGSLKYGLGNAPVRYLMLAAPFTAGVGIYVFYALQPYLLELFGDPKAYSIAGLAAAIVAGSQIAGGFLAPLVRRLFKKRTTVLILSTGIGALLLVSLGFITNFWVALIVLVAWGVMGSVDDPIRRAYLNGLIPSKQRATVLSFESLMGNVGGIGIQPALGRVADLSGYAFSLARRRCDQRGRGAVHRPEPLAEVPGRHRVDRGGRALPRSCSLVHRDVDRVQSLGSVGEHVDDLGRLRLTVGVGGPNGEVMVAAGGVPAVAPLPPGVDRQLGRRGPHPPSRPRRRAPRRGRCRCAVTTRRRRPRPRRPGRPSCGRGTSMRDESLIGPFSVQPRSVQ